MKPGFFIDRPVFSTVLSILIVIVGIIGLALLPVDQYPQITPPVVKISATYPGASALTVSQAVATPICLLYTSPSPRDRQKSRMPSSA